MSPVLMSSHNIILAATMAVSGAAIFLSFARPKPTPISRDRPLRSCLSSDERRREKEEEKKKVRFSDDVKVFELQRSQPSIKKSVRRDNKKIGKRTKEKLFWDEIVVM